MLPCVQPMDAISMDRYYWFDMHPGCDSSMHHHPGGIQEDDPMAQDDISKGGYAV